MVARIQQGITLALLAGALTWFGCWVDTSPWLALVGALALVFAWSSVLALELLLLHVVNRGDPTPTAAWTALLTAWAGETITSARVFFWNQPFRRDAFKDQLGEGQLPSGKRGIVFVHGYFCNRGFWNPWLRYLQAQQHPFIALTLCPVWGAIDDYAVQLDEAVTRMAQATGLPPLLVCHSMGGLVARAWLRQSGALANAHHIVTIGTPHRGTWLARFGTSLNAKQMRLRSSWLARLDDELPAHSHMRFTCWYSNTDNIVFPTANATLAGADNRLVQGVAHVEMAFLPQVMKVTLAMAGVKY